MKRRRVIQLVLLLLLLLGGGAIVNVAVAWGCLIALPKNYDSHKVSELTTDGARDLLDDHFPDAGLRLSDVRPFGDTHARLGWSSTTAIWDDQQAIILFVDSVCAGWPAHGMKGWRRSRYESHLPKASLKHVYVGSIVAPDWTKRKRPNHASLDFLPVRPLWPGFAINTIFYASILWVVFAVPLVLRRRRRMQRGLCPACAYPVGTSPVCTECGKQLA